MPPSGRETADKPDKNDAARPPRDRSPLTSPVAVLLFLGLTAAGLAADLWSKEAVFHSLLNDPTLPRRVEVIRAVTGHRTPRELIADLKIQRQVMPGVQFTLSTNAGVVFGTPMPRWAVAVATVVTIGLVLFFFATSERRGWIVHVALAFILAGALGNLYDRLFSEVVVAPGVPPILHEVRDFIDCSQLHYKYVFNVADALLVLGVLGLLLQWAVTRKKPAAKAAKSEKP